MTKTLRILACLFTACSALGQDTVFSERTYTSEDGQRTFVGTVSDLQYKKITVKLSDGETMTFSTDKLSKADQEFLGQGITFTALDGKSYENVSVSRVSAGTLVLMKPSGIVSVAMENLPESMRNRFGFDPAKAQMERDAFAKGQAARRAQMEAQKAAKAKAAAVQKELARARKMTFKILQAGAGEGALAYHYTKGGYSKTRATIGALTGSGSSGYVAPSQGALVFLSGKLPSGTVDNNVITVTVVSDGTYQYTSTLGATNTVTKYKILK